MQLWRSPIRILILYLTALTLVASFGWVEFSMLGWLMQLRNFCFILVPGWGLYQVLLSLQWIKPTRWEHRVITALILFLLFDSLTPWWIFLILGLVAELVQRLVRLPTGPLLNPAATTAVVLSLFGHHPTWWGTNFGPRLEIVEGGLSAALLLTVPLASYVAYKYKKLWSVAAALGTFSVAYIVLFRVSPLYLVSEGTLLFFMLVMAIEPKTSPVLKPHQLWFGAALGLLTGLALYSYWSEPFSMALLIMNMIFNLYRNKSILITRFQQRFSSNSAPAV
jgi:Na+-translocating ferredoxin:NAD+ oxidoreductase RnfD subunit